MKLLGGPIYLCSLVGTWEITSPDHRRLLLKLFKVDPWDMLDNFGFHVKDKISFI